MNLTTKNYKIQVEYGVSAVIFLIGTFFIFQAFTIDTTREMVGPRTLPMVLAISIVLGSIWLALRAFLGNTGEIKKGYGFLESDMRRIVMVISCGAIFVIAFFLLGYFTALFFTFIAMLYTFSVRSWLKMLVSSIILAIIFQWLFMGIMLLNDPKGSLIDMRPFTNWITGAQ